jgi:hypothetical protein
LHTSTGTAVGEVTVGTTPEVALLAVNTSRKNFSIQARPANTGNIYILYVTGVATNKYKVILQPGDFYSDDKWTGVVKAVASASGQLCGVQEES